MKKNIINNLWPIKKTELKSFLSMAILMFCILFNLGVLKSLKDSLIVPNIGAEAISFLKLCLVLPSALIFTVIYVKLNNKFKIQTIFVIVVTVFIITFLIFGYVIYPNYDYYHPSKSLILELQMSFPFMKWPIKIFSLWSFVIVYVVADLWSVVVISIMFWQFVNEHVPTDQAKRVYPFLIMIGNTGLFVAGSFLIFCNSDSMFFNIVTSIFTNQYPTNEVLIIKLIVTVVASFAIISMCLIHYSSNVMISKTICTKIKHKPKLSVRESFKLILGSKYIFNIAVLVLCYNIAINVTESCWKSKIKIVYSSTKQYLEFMGYFNLWLGIVSVIFTFIGSYIIRNYSWKRAAMISPMLIGIAGSLFFLLILLLSKINISSNLIAQPIIFVIFVGAVQNIISKSSKYSVFEVTKEMTYIPLPIELKSKGKASVEVLGNKFGKAFGAILQACAFTMIPNATFDSISPILMFVFIIVIIVWFIAIKKLDKQYNKLVSHDQ